MLLPGNSTSPSRGEISALCSPDSAGGRLPLQKQSLFCSLSLTYHTGLTLATNGHTVFSVGGEAKVTFFCRCRMNHESSFDGLHHGRGPPPRVPRQGSHGPDLSHLTPEERSIIQGVMQKQQVSPS